MAKEIRDSIRLGLFVLHVGKLGAAKLMMILPYKAIKLQLLNQTNVENPHDDYNNFDGDDINILALNYRQ